MSWIRESEKSWGQTFCAKVVKSGPIPKHVAIIMDGNRRFAKRNNFDRAKGHLMGFDKLAQTLEWCKDLGINEVTVYAFSIENFKRSKEEVECLMEIAREKFASLMEEKENLKKYGVCIRVLGNLELLPLDIQEMIAESVNYTKDHDKVVLNVCFAYTSRDEICTAMRETAEGVQMGSIKETDISERLLESCLYTNKSPRPDLLVRTSGEVRLSDFLLWQTSYSVLSFMQVLWPDFSVWHLYAGVLHYQQNYDSVMNAIDEMEIERDRIELESDHQCVLQEMEKEGGNGFHKSNLNIQERIALHREERGKRIQTFLNHVQSKRDNYITNLCQKSNKCRKL